MELFVTADRTEVGIKRNANVMKIIKTHLGLCAVEEVEKRTNIELTSSATTKSKLRYSKAKQK